MADVVEHTPILRMVALLVLSWLAFSGLLFLTERGVDGSSIDSYGRALYWGVAAFSTAGIADAPKGGWSALVGGLWIVIGSMLFFGTVVATITAYFMRPLQRPVHQIVDAVEYNLERMDDLGIEELELLKETVDTLIEHMETHRLADAGDRPSGGKAGRN